MYTEIKYLNLLSSRLDKFKKKKDCLWNFRCPICGDSQKNKNKARAFVFQVRGDLVFKCHNCGSAMGLSNLIEKLDPELYKEFRLEKFTETQKPKITPKERKQIHQIFAEKPSFETNVLDSLTRIDDLNNSHSAKAYLINRKLPTQHLYYVEKFKEWTNTVKPNTFENFLFDEERIIIPLLDTDGTLFGYQGRSISNTSNLRYITILLDETKSKIFGLDRANFDQPIYITEGPFDSLLLENSIAMAGSDLSDYSGICDGKRVFVYDNEPRNRAITDRMLKQIESGESIVIWPIYISEKYKDINDMHLAGFDVNELVKNNTYQGLTATLLLNQWKK